MRPSRSAGLALLAALLLAAATAPAARAIGGGRPDSDDHPAAGMMGIEHDGFIEAWCSGFYAGRSRQDPRDGVFVTAGHCLADLEDLDLTAGNIRVTFDTHAHYDMDTFTAVAADWRPAIRYRFRFSGAEDYGVILLRDTVAGLAGMAFPAAGLLDDLAARGGLRPGTLFDNVGYGFVPHFKRAPATYEAPPGRMVATSRFSALTRTHLRLLANSDAGYGGGCYGDSGGPVLLHASDTVVAMTAGGDPLCRATVTPTRLDIPAARAFFDDFIELP